MKEIKTKIIQGDCKDVLKTIDDNSIDLIIALKRRETVISYGEHQAIGAIIARGKSAIMTQKGERSCVESLSGLKW